MTKEQCLKTLFSNSVLRLESYSINLSQWLKDKPQPPPRVKSFLIKLQYLSFFLALSLSFYLSLARFDCYSLSTCVITQTILVDHNF